MNVKMYPLILVILLLASGFFSSAEIAFSSLNKIKLKNWANNDDLRSILDNFLNGGQKTEFGTVLA